MTPVPAVPTPAGDHHRVRRTLVLTGYVLAAVLGAAGGLVFVSMEDMPDIRDITQQTATAGSKLYDSADTPELFAQLAMKQRTFVPLARVPRAMQDATMAIEDIRFYSHWGVDLWGIARATIVNLIHRRVVEGASTITQQLARTLFLNPERTMQRKIKEILLAIQIERTYKKDEILEMYLNQVYFGSGAYGVEQASREYFGKHVEELTLPECALLAGLFKAPSGYSPRADLEKARQRRNLVLQKMAENGFIPANEAAEVQASPVHLQQTELTNAPYFAAHVRKHLEEAYGSQAILRGGLSVYTTLNLHIQTVAQRALEQGLAAAEGLLKGAGPVASGGGVRRLQGALVALDPRTGAILAMIGGRNYRENEFNRATQAKRQPGSSFKPIIYTTAFLNGFTPADRINDDPQEFPGKDGKAWKPTNFERKNFGETTLRRALALSRNVVTVKLLNKVGIYTVTSEAKKFGFSGPFRTDLTLALGTSEVGLLEMVSAFSVFANGGIRSTPYSIKLVKDSQGAVLEQHRPELTSVLTPQVSYLTLSILQDAVNYGTAHVIRKMGFTRPAGGKTGTTNDFTDAWFIGLTPRLACGIWIGYDDRRTMGKNATGGLIAAPIWASFMGEALENAPLEDFDRPTGLVTTAIDPTSGLVAGKDCKKVLNEIFLEGTQPTRVCDVHRTAVPFSVQDQEGYERSLTPTGSAVEPPGPSGQRGPLTPEEQQSQDGGF